MTVEELRKTAKSMGYNILPINPKEKLLPCTCGNKKREHWSRYDQEEHRFYEYLVCPKCGKESSGKTEDEARRNWNLLIREEEKSWQKPGT